MILGERGNEVLLTPGAVYEISIYGEGEIAEWDKADKLPEDERKRRNRDSNRNGC